MSKKGLISHRKGKTHRQSSIELMKTNSGRAKNIYVYNIDGSLLAEFNNIQKAAKAMNISRMLAGKYSKEPSLIDSKKNDQYYVICLNLIQDVKSLLPDLNFNTGAGSSKFVNVYLNDGSFFKLFSSIKEATLETGVSKKMILKYSDLEPPVLIKNLDDIGYYFSLKPNFNKSNLFMLS